MYHSGEDACKDRGLMGNLCLSLNFAKKPKTALKIVLYKKRKNQIYTLINYL